MKNVQYNRNGLLSSCLVIDNSSLHILAQYDIILNGTFVRTAVIKPPKFCAPLAMTASGKLHCGVATIRQWLVWAVFNRR